MKLDLGFDGMAFAAEADSSIRRASGGYVVSGGEVAILHPFKTTQFYRHGWNSWSPTGWRTIGDAPLRIYDNPERLLTADDQARDMPNGHAGSALGILDAGDGQVLLLGALNLGGRVGADSRTLWGDYEAEASEWFVGFGEEETVLAGYSRLLVEKFGHASAPRPTVWSSWYSHFEGVTEDQMRTVITDLAGYPIDVIQLDDGWQTAVGDWNANDDFPSGLNSFVDDVSEAGFTPGLWLAPLICVPSSQLALERPEWLLRDIRGHVVIAGHNWGTHYYTLDTTIRAVQDHLRGLFEGLIALGFQYFKLDFMYAGALPGQRSVDIPREVAYRRAIELIRSVVGPDTYLLGSGVPMLASIGVFDGVRVGPDVAPYWDNSERPRDPSGPGALNAVANSLNRTWMKDLYHLDSDVVFFRSRQNLLDGPSRLVLQDVATILGFKSTSDPIDWLDALERTAMRRFFEEDAKVLRLGRFVFTIDGRLVDFRGILSPEGRVSDRLLVK